SVSTEVELSLNRLGLLPFRDYDLGDIVQVSVSDGDAELFPVLSVNLSFSQTSELTGSIELGKRQILPEMKLAESVKNVTGGLARDVVAGRAPTQATPRPAVWDMMSEGVLSDTASAEDRAANSEAI